MGISSRLSVIALVSSALAVACTTAGSTPSGLASVSPAAQGSAPPPSLAASASVVPSSSASPVASPTGLAPDTIATTIVDGVRVRSAPTVDPSSAKLEPLLPKDTRLFVIAGPTSADGYDWYHVVPIQGGGLPSGWVARAAREGEPWIASDPPPCPTSPIDVQAMLELTGYGGLACFGGNEIQLVGDIECAAADVDYTVSGPTWMHDDRHCLIGSGETELMEFNDGGIPGLILPTAGAAKLTGHFDDEQATTCVYALMDPPVLDPAEIVAGCRASFVATALEMTP